MLGKLSASVEDMFGSDCAEDATVNRLIAEMDALSMVHIVTE